MICRVWQLYYCCWEKLEEYSKSKIKVKRMMMFEAFLFLWCFCHVALNLLSLKMLQEVILKCFRSSNEKNHTDKWNWWHIELQIWMLQVCNQRTPMVWPAAECVTWILKFGTWSVSKRTELRNKLLLFPVFVLVLVKGQAFEPTWREDSVG